MRWQKTITGSIGRRGWNQPSFRLVNLQWSVWQMHWKKIWTVISIWVKLLRKKWSKKVLKRRLNFLKAVLKFGWRLFLLPTKWLEPNWPGNSPLLPLEVSGKHWNTFSPEMTVSWVFFSWFSEITTQVIQTIPTHDSSRNPLTHYDSSRIKVHGLRAWSRRFRSMDVARKDLPLFTSLPSLATGSNNPSPSA